MSTATASRVLNGTGRHVAPPLRKRVLAAAEQLDYVPNAHAQALMRPDTQTVGVIAFDVNNPYFTEIIGGILGVATRTDRLVTIGNVFRDPDTELRYLALMRSQRIGSLVLTGSGWTGSRARLATPGPPRRLPRGRRPRRAHRPSRHHRRRDPARQRGRRRRGGAGAARAGTHAHRRRDRTNRHDGHRGPPARVPRSVRRGGPRRAPRADRCGQLHDGGRRLGDDRAARARAGPDGGVLPLRRDGRRGTARAAPPGHRRAGGDLRHRVRRHRPRGEPHAGALDRPRSARGARGGGDAAPARAEEAVEPRTLHFPTELRLRGTTGPR